MSKKKRHATIRARTIHRFSVLIILAWLAITVIMTIGVPPLEQVAKEHSVSVDPTDAPSFKAMKRMGEVFNESNSNSVAMIVLEGQQRLGDDVHQYYDSLIRQLKDDPHVMQIHDFWRDPLTAPAAESADGKAVFVQLDLTGNPGETSANDSAEAVKGIVDRTPPPPEVKTYVTGTAPLAADLGESGNSNVAKVTGLSMAVILIMLLLFFRSIVTVILLLLMVGMELQVARGIVAFLGHNEVIGLTAYAVSLLVSLDSCWNGLRDILLRSVSRGASGRTARSPAHQPSGWLPGSLPEAHRNRLPPRYDTGQRPRWGPRAARRQLTMPR